MILSSPAVTTNYYVVAIACAAGVAALVAFEGLPNRKTAPIFFGLLCLITLFAFRWPILFAHGPLNPDEAQMTAQAITLARLPIPWKSYDGTTSGPLNSAVLTLSYLVGHRPDLFSSRTIGLLLIFGMLACLYLAVRGLYGELAARLAIVPLLFFYCTALEPDFVHYSSEHLSLFLLALAGLLIADWARSQRSRLKLIGAGAIIGAIPFAKLQASPIAAILALTVLAILVRHHRDAGGDLSRRLGEFITAILAVPILIVIIVVAGGSFSDFVTSYILMPLHYGEGGDPAGLDFFLNASDEVYVIFLTISVLVFCASVAIGIERQRALGGPQRGAWLPLLPPIAMLTAAIYAAAEPHVQFWHYLLFLTLPLAAVSSFALGICLNAVQQLGTMTRLSLAVTLMLPFVILRLHDGNGYVDRLGVEISGDRGPVETMLIDHVHANETLSVWGWEPNIYVVTGTIMGTRDSICQFQIAATRYRDYYRARYLRDIEANRPDFFVDAVAPGSFAFTDRATEGLESYPELAAFIAQNYRLTSEAAGVRLYSRDAAAIRPTVPSMPGARISAAARSVASSMPRETSMRSI